MPDYFDLEVTLAEIEPPIRHLAVPHRNREDGSCGGLSLDNPADHRDVLEEVMNSKCMICGTRMRSTRQTRRYECGLRGVTLVDIEVLECPECGEDEVVIPKIAELHACLATVVASNSRPLGPREIRFLQVPWQEVEVTPRIGPDGLCSSAAASGFGYDKPRLFAMPCAKGV